MNAEEIIWSSWSTSWSLRRHCHYYALTATCATATRSQPTRLCLKTNDFFSPRIKKTFRERFEPESCEGGWHRLKKTDNTIQIGQPCLLQPTSQRIATFSTKSKTKSCPTNSSQIDRWISPTWYPSWITILCHRFHQQTTTNHPTTV